MKLAPQVSRYSLASGFAFALDVAVYLALAASGVWAALAGVIGYAIGLTFHFVCSVRFIFDPAVTAKSEPRLFGEFAASGLVGLALTACVIAISTDGLHLGPVTAKGLAAGASFLAVFMLRRSVVFAPRMARPLESGVVSR